MHQPRPSSPWLRLISCAILFAIYIITSGPANIPSMVIFVVSLLGVGIFEPVYTMIGLWIRELARFILSLFRLLAPHIGGQPVQFAGVQAVPVSRVYTIITPLLVLIIIAILVYNPLQTFIIAIKEYHCIYQSLNIPTICGTGIGAKPLSTSDGSTIRIGLINGNDGSPFDLSRLNGPERQVENLIINENKRYCSQKHITLAVVTMLSRTGDNPALSANVGLADLQGAYLAQKEYNQKTSSIKICLAIANVGTGSPTELPQAVSQVLNQLVLFSKYETTFRGIVGFPYSRTNVAALSIYGQYDYWKQTPIPIISPSATSNQLNNQRNFYRVVSSDQIQTEAMVDFIEQRFKTKTQSTPAQIAVFVDSNDTYSKSLHDSFINTIDIHKSNIVTVDESYKILDPSALKEPVADAVRKRVDFIFFAGYANDLDAVENQLQIQRQQQGAANKPIPILGGDGLFDVERYMKVPYSVVYSTVYASPVKIDNKFAQGYTKAFGPPSVLSPSRDSYSYLPPHAILSHDAVHVFESVLDQIGGNDVPLQQVFNDTLGTVNSNGISGSISFHATGPDGSNPLNKPVYILCTSRDSALHLAAHDIPGTNLTLDNANECIEPEHGTNSE